MLTTQDLKQQVGFYGDVMQNVFHVTPIAFFPQVPVRIELMQDFLTQNSGLAGFRVYLGKKSADPLVGDYEMIFVPCSLVTNPDGSQYLEDMIGRAVAANVFTMAIECRKPPGCDQGALLL